MLREIDRWANGTVRRWDELARRLVMDHPLPPPIAARAFALLSVAMYDAMIAAWDCKFAYLRARPSKYPGAPTVYGSEPATPSYVSERAAISNAAAEVLAYVFPPDEVPEAIHVVHETLHSAYDADLYAGIHFRSDVTAGAELGAAVAARVLAVARSDGSQLKSAYKRSLEAGRWAPTPQNDGGPPVVAPLLPQWGQVRTWALARGDVLRPMPPPIFGGSEWNLQYKEVYDASRLGSPERTAAALEWAGGPGTETPAGRWGRIACAIGASHGLSEPRFARMLAAVHIAQHDAFVACWDAKYAYDCSRPVTEIRARIDASWLPTINTPPFPSYPSGHATTSGAASQILLYFFPDEAARITSQSAAARDSRLFGGIHTRADNDAGLDLGRAVASLVLRSLERDGAE